jgi:hypothetical protein
MEIIITVLAIALILGYAVFRFFTEYIKITRLSNKFSIKRELTPEESKMIEAANWIQSKEGEKFIIETIIKEAEKQGDHQAINECLDLINNQNK